MTAADELTIAPATPADRETLVNLLQLYFYDFSEYDDDEAEVDERGRFPEYRHLDRYWSEPDERFPFLIRRAGQLIGCALVRRLDRPGQVPTWGMAEFFILRRHRRQGLGQRAAVALFDRFPGRWEVGQLHKNLPAIAFWRRVIGAYTGGRYQEEGTDDPRWEGPVQIFYTPE